MRLVNVPPTLRSLDAEGVCQSSEAAFHFMMCSGVTQWVHTLATGAWIRASTVMRIAWSFISFVGLLFLFLMWSSGLARYGDSFVSVRWEMRGNG
jgi:hypothetical protein